MTRREARMRALSDAAEKLDAICDMGYPEDLDAESGNKVHDAMRDIARALGRRFAAMVLTDTRNSRKWTRPTPPSEPEAT